MNFGGPVFSSGIISLVCLFFLAASPLLCGLRAQTWFNCSMEFSQQKSMPILLVGCWFSVGSTMSSNKTGLGPEVCSFRIGSVLANSTIESVLGDLESGRILIISRVLFFWGGGSDLSSKILMSASMLVSTRLPSRLKLRCEPGCGEGRFGQDPIDSLGSQLVACKTFTKIRWFSF